MLRFSSYSVLSNRMPGGGYILLNGLSGSLDVITDALGSLLEPRLSQSPHLANALLNQIDRNLLACWQRQGYVTELTLEEERKLVVDMAEAVHDAGRRHAVRLTMTCAGTTRYTEPRMLQTRKSVSQTIVLDLGKNGLAFDRADLKFSGIEQAGNSFEGRVFLNNPMADEHTPTTEQYGYVGSFHVYGYGLWPGDIGKDAPARGTTSEGPRAPIEKTLIATAAVRDAAAQNSEVTITVVPVYAGQPPRSAMDALKLQAIKVVID